MRFCSGVFVYPTLELTNINDYMSGGGEEEKWRKEKERVKRRGRELI